ncbi:MAG: hypothetical protein IH571_00500, partial [Acholeplasmataceae bacterium]|nr:hypothetical protein [Acholeplasmataceae bacterium]
TKIINHGIPGDTTGGVLDRLFLSTKLQMKKYFIHIGINDLVLTDLSFEQIAQNIITIKEEIEKACPHAEVFVISLTPVLETHEISNKDFILWRNNTQIIQINTLLFKKSTVINIHTPLLKDNRLNPEFTSDGIHLNDMGYQVYYETIKPFL